MGGRGERCWCARRAAVPWARADAASAEIKQACSRLEGLSKEWTDAQLTCADGVRACREAFSELMGQERATDQARKGRVAADRAVKKACKGLDAARRKGENTLAAQAKVRQAQNLLDASRNEERELEEHGHAARQSSLSKALAVGAGAHLHLFERGKEVFEAQLGLAERLRAGTSAEPSPQMPRALLPAAVDDEGSSTRRLSMQSARSQRSADHCSSPIRRPRPVSLGLDDRRRRSCSGPAAPLPPTPTSGAAAEHVYAEPTVPARPCATPLCRL